MHDDELSSILDGILPTYTTDEHEAQGPVRFIDIHIYDLPERDAFSPVEEHTGPIVESTPPAPEPEASEPVTAPRTHKPLVPWLLACLCLLAIATLLAVFSLVPLMTLQATITIVPVSRQLPLVHSTFHVVNGPAQGHQLPGRALPAISMSQQQTATATGIGHQDATVAHGSVTLYNASLVSQIVPAGTLLTGYDGVQIVTDQDAMIPGALYPRFGQTTVSAHTVQAGPQGNIRAGDVYGPCCRLNVSVASSAFSGGQNARTYQTVKQADIDAAVSHLKASLTASVQAALQVQVRSNETLLTPLTCKQQVGTDHQAGEEATSVSVTVQAICTGEVYATDAYQQAGDWMTTQAAQATFGTGYSRAGAVVTTIREMRPTDHSGVDLIVTCTATYVYQFSQSEILHLKTLIAGKSKAEATRLLLQATGVQSVSLSLSAGQTLPTDPSRIAFNWLAYAAS